MFQNRKLLIATKHSKENVIKPIFENALGVECFCENDFDTDIFGTFTGEFEREKSAIETVKIKCLTALKQYHCDLGIASEGSFSSHPIAGFLPINEELLVFIDLKNDIEIYIKEISMETNFSSTYVHNWQELQVFTQHVGFPNHALILKPTPENQTDVFKGIVLENQLKITFEYLIQKYQKVFVTTDMRAMYNPKRMKVIEKAAFKLLEKIKSVCPQCNSLGFGVEDIEKGLPCSWCNQPTESILYYVKRCKKCNYVYKMRNPHKKFEEPMYCNTCNP